jgi:HlyD family secretion protein
MKKVCGRNLILTIKKMKLNNCLILDKKKNIYSRVLILLAILPWLFLCQCSSSDNQNKVGIKSTDYKAKKGPLTISVVESGTIKAKEQVIIKNQVEGKTTILSLIKEGTPVKKGDLLIELDASKLEDAKIDQQIKVQNAEAAFIRTRENLEVVKNQAQSEIEKAELAFRFATEDLIKYKEGEYPKDLKSANAKITLAREELQRAEEKLKWSKILFDEKYISLTELQADELSAQKTTLDLELAIADLDLLQNYAYKRKLAELTSDEKQTEMALERTRRKASADIVQAEAEFRAKESEYSRETSKLEKTNEQIAKTIIKAPIDGLVVYATSAQGNWRGNAEPLDEGQEVREQQELIYLPASGSVKAEAKIHESNLDKVKRGLLTRVTVDALPGITFTGTVDTIAPLPDAVSVWLNPDLKLYATDILLEDGISGLRTGMSCQVEIIIEQYNDVIYIPVQAISRIDGHSSVYVKSGSKWKVRPVEIGLDNNRMVHIISGLDRGEEVLLTPPLTEEKPPRKSDEPKKTQKEPEKS